MNKSEFYFTYKGKPNNRVTHYTTKLQDKASVKRKFSSAIQLQWTAMNALVLLFIVTVWLSCKNEINVPFLSRVKLILCSLFAKKAATKKGSLKVVKLLKRGRKCYYPYYVENALRQWVTGTASG